MAERGLRYVNRQRGAGTRMLLDHELARRGIAPEAIVGYEREEHTHLAVAAAVAAGRADCGLGVLAAARAFGLDFVPVAQEPYDLVFEPDPILDPLWTLLESDDFRRAVTDLGGYDTAEMGPPDPLNAAFSVRHGCVRRWRWPAGGRLLGHSQRAARPAVRARATGPPPTLISTSRNAADAAASASTTPVRASPRTAGEADEATSTPSSATSAAVSAI